MATHSSILAWRIQWTEEPGTLQSIGSHRVGCDWSSLACRHTIWTYLASQVALVVKNPPATAVGVRDKASTPGLGRPPGGGHGNPLQCYCLENPMDRGAWRAQSRGLKKSDMAEATWHTRTHFVLAALQSEVQNGLLCVWTFAGKVKKKPNFLT